MDKRIVLFYIILLFLLLFFIKICKTIIRNTDMDSCSVWTTKDGRKIKISDMSTRHIENALRMLKRKGFIAESILNFYMYTSGPSGEMAQYAFEQEARAIFETPTTPYIDIFKEELRKRNNYITNKDLKL